jgi:hypothetical protein
MKLNRVLYSSSEALRESCNFIFINFNFISDIEIYSKWARIVWFKLILSKKILFV